MIVSFGGIDLAFRKRETANTAEVGMRRFLTILFVLTFATSAYAGDVGWTLSDSPTSAFSNLGSPVAGLVSIYLWFYCINAAEGLASAEFGIAGTSVPLSFTPANGFLNAGGAANLLLAVGGCPYGPVMAGTFVFFDQSGAGFNACIVPSATNGLNVSVYCIGLGLLPNDYIGYANDGTLPCESEYELCTYSTSVADASWGTVKSFYR
jgi:hypothetical protein